MVIEDSDLDFETGSVIAVEQADSLHMERTRIRGSIAGFSGGVIDISNSLVMGQISLPSGQGSIRFSTIVTSGGGTGSQTVPRVIKAGTGVTVRESIVWAGGASDLPLGGGCSVINSIVGPTAVAGALNMDPQFVSFSDYHLSANSPARDLATTGPALDFEGNVRPNGAGYDLGADELR